MSDGELPIWAVYDHPRDWPGCYVASATFGYRTPGDVRTIKGMLAALAVEVT